MLQVGTKAPEFSLPDQNGKMHTLSEYAGKKDQSAGGYGHDRCRYRLWKPYLQKRLRLWYILLWKSPRLS